MIIVCTYVVAQIRYKLSIKYVGTGLIRHQYSVDLSKAPNSFQREIEAMHMHVRQLNDERLPRPCTLDTVQDFLSKLVIKPYWQSLDILRRPQKCGPSSNYKWKIIKPLYLTNQCSGPIKCEKTFCLLCYFQIL